MHDSDIRIIEAEAHFSDEKAREPLKFGNVVLTAISYAQVRVRAENRRGEVADGWGAILLSDSWAWPSQHVDHANRDAAMRDIILRLCRRLPEEKRHHHPLEFHDWFDHELRLLAQQATDDLALAEPVPHLCALVSASPVDAAIHDAFGNANGISTYDGYGPDYCNHDLSHWLGDSFKGHYLSKYINSDYEPEVRVFHVVGGLDKLRESEVTPESRKDELPHSLEGWMLRDGVTCLKIKLRGRDLPWDLERIIEVDKVAREIQARQGIADLHLSVDTNEQCETAEYMVELLNKLRAQSPAAFNALVFVEQPTQRDLEAHPIDLREVSALKPVIVDESLWGLEEMDRALELGWSGMALKTCKTQSLSLLVAAKCAEADVPYVVMDLSNPGLALLQSVGLAARLSPLIGVEANARQYFPAISGPEAAVHPSIFSLDRGKIRTSSLTGNGFGYRIGEIERAVFKTGV